MDTRAKRPTGTLPFARLTADQMRKMRVQHALDNPPGTPPAARTYVPTQADIHTAHTTPRDWTHVL